ncbi:RNA polymerase-associated protein [Actinidia chinensis var. chinensis]|uniref:RNA polymerase-associated protein n=1 Tax=Actinidia chinensis var. chinensis TaxID=1590841 RepID=A0A2R6PT13_ACTCC|nr:RNA polymerase-associated protein [Actinidia chinensis var. chinensis]
MEIECEGGTKILLKNGFKREIGRGLGFDSKDRTISRRHVSFEIRTHPTSNARVRFEVIGKNPMWVYHSASGEIRVFRNSEGDEMEAGDMFCVSAKKPVWFAVKRLEFEGEDEREVEREMRSENEMAEGIQSGFALRSIEDLDIDSLDVSDIDPVKEFGFLVIGHEFNHYPKQMIRHANTWDWFLDERKEESEDDEVSDKKGKIGARRKRKKGEGNDDDEWMVENEDDKELITKIRKVQRPKYSTRSTDREKTNKGSVQKKTISVNEDDEDDDTLGGFIVTNDNMEEEEEINEEE